MNKLNFLDRLLETPPIILSGGYLFEAERRGYLTAGEFVPMVALEHPEILKQITTDFLRAGSDIALAFTYNGHREKMKLLGQEDLLEPLNRAAMAIAVEAANEQRAAQSRDIYVAGNISNSNIFDPADESSKSAVRMMYREMISWAKEEGADLIVAETMYYFEEAKIALEEIQLAGLPSIINVAIFAKGVLRDGVSAQDACRALAEAGADGWELTVFTVPKQYDP